MYEVDPRDRDVESEGITEIRSALNKSGSVSTTSSRDASKGKNEVIRHDLEDGGEVSILPETAKASSQVWVLVIVSLITLIAGSFQSVSSKWMNLQVVPRCDDDMNPDCSAEAFNAPFYQSWIMYVGEAACILIYYAGKWYKKSTGKGFGALEVPRSAASYAKKEASIWWWAVPTILDLTGSTMTNYAYLYTYASTVQVLRNFLILLTAFTQIMWLRKPLRYYEWAGACVVTLGMIVTCVYQIKEPEEDTGHDQAAYVGILLSILGTVFTSIQIIFEEFVLTKYHYAVLKAVGVEGCFGIVICGLVMLICQYAGWEDEKAAFYQMGHSAKLLGSQFCYFVCVIGFNGGGLAVTYIGSGLLRTILFSARSIIIWLFELAAKWNTFDWYNFFGLVLCFIGSLWFNNIIRFPCIPSFQGWLETEAGCCGMKLKFTDRDAVNEQIEKSGLVGADLEPRYDE